MFQKTVIIGFMLFALFFGAGNLIFPVQLGWDSGAVFWPAIFGFLITGVGMPLLGVIAGSLYTSGFPGVMDKKICHLYSLVFMVAIYLTIGPLFAIPRTATTSYEIGIVPLVGSNSSLFLFIFSLLYFALVLYFSLNPSRMVKAIGKYLTPTLLIFIAVLCVMAFFELTTPVSAVQFKGEPFSTGFIEGYKTMDTIASVAFAIIVLSSVTNYGINKETGLFKYCFYAAIIAGVCLGIVYLSLGWIGNHYQLDQATLAKVNAEGQHLGAFLLVTISSFVLGNTGQLLVSVIVFLACLSTAIGLVVAVSGYFFAKFPKIKYEYYVWIFTVISFVLSNQGLASVIKASIPVLMVLYPITIVLILLVFLERIKELPNLVFQFTIGVTTVISITSVLANYFNFAFAKNIVTLIPLNEFEFEWMIPALAAIIISFAVAKISQTKTTLIE